MNNLYTIEKIRALEQERMSKLPPNSEPQRPRRKPVFGPLAAGAGRTLRRLGEGLESWGTVPAPDDRRQARQT